MLESRNWQRLSGFASRRIFSTKKANSLPIAEQRKVIMTRAGREPAEDVKRRLVCAAQEVGLTAVNACMHLGPNARIIHVGASFPEWPYESPTVALMARIPVTGLWPEVVDVRCCATEGDPAQTDGPWMKGRDNVPFPDLVGQLQATLEERQQVIASTKAGIPGPYRFERSVWERVDLLKEIV